MVAPDVVDIESEYFVVYLSCVYIYFEVVYIFRLVMPSYLLFCCIYFNAWCITCCPNREETLEVYTVMGVVLVLGLLVLVYKILYIQQLYV